MKRKEAKPQENMFQVRHRKSDVVSVARNFACLAGDRELVVEGKSALLSCAETGRETCDGVVWHCRWLLRCGISICTEDDTLPSLFCADFELVNPR